MKPMNVYGMFKTDPEMEAGAGIEIDYGQFQIQIHRAGGANKKFNSLLNKKMEPYRRLMALGTMDEDKAKEIMAEVFADTVIIGWKGVCDEEGKAIPFNRANVLNLLLTLGDLFTDIQDQANRLSNFRAKEKIEDAKK